MDGNDIWEILFGLLKGDVPDCLTPEVLEELATTIRLAAEERGARMALEAAAKVAEDMAMVLPIEECCVLHGDLVIAAIRQIDTAALGAE